MKKPGEEIDDDFSRKVAELVELIKRLPPDRIEELQRAIEERKKSQPQIETSED